MAVTDGDTIQVVVHISCPQLVEALNIFAYRLDDPVPDAPSAAQIITAVQQKIAAMSDDVKGIMTDDFTFEKVTVNKVEWDGSKWEIVENIGEGSINVTGTISANDMLPHGIAGVVTARTSRPQSRGRKFLPGISESNTTDGLFSSAVLTALASYAAEWLLDQLVTGSAELVPVLLSQSGPTAGTVFPLVSAGSDNIPGYQRRRKPGVGS